jgi:enoyl-CoA hydratase/carnithine racemase
VTTPETIRYETADAVATITLNRPDRLNAVNALLIRELVGAFDRADDDDGVRAVIVTGAGRAFCAGADLGTGGNTFDRRAHAPEEHRDGGGLVSLRVFDMKKPVIAAINGPAVGFGITMTLPMDIRLASSAARMGFVFARRGVVPEACSTWFLPRLVGISRAAEWTYTGRVFSAEEALAAGLVSRVVAPEALLPAARELAQEIAQNTSAVSVALIRQMLWRMLGADHPMEAHRIDSLGMAYTGRSADAYEGITSFLEKRPPRFSQKPSTDMPPFYPWWPPRPF